MKRSVSLFLIATILVTLTSCGESPTKEIKPPEKPFSFDQPTPTDEATIAYYTNNDTLNTLYAASPYYMGAQPSSLPGFAQYDYFKKAKRDEAIALTSALLDASKTLKTNLEPFKAAYLEFMGIAMKTEKKLGKYAYESGGIIAENAVREEGLIANIESIHPAEGTNPQASSLYNYQKTMLTLSLADAVLKDYTYVLSSSAVLDNLFATHSDPIKGALQDFENQMEKIADLNNALNDVKNKTIAIEAALQQISTGDYYLAQASVAYLQENLPDIKVKTASITPSDTFKTDDIEMMKQYANYIESFSTTIDEQIKNVDQKQLISVADLQLIAGKDSPLIPRAYAKSDEMLAAAYTSYAQDAPTTASTISTLKNAASSLAHITWQGAKHGFQATQTIVGVTLDTVGAITKSTFDVGQGIINGNTVSEITGEIGGNFKKIKDNFKNGTSGSEILTEAGKQLEGAEDLVTNGLEGTIGKGWTSWAVGGLAKITVGMFTGFGKGIYKLANKQSTVGTLIEGGLDVGLSLIGGSKTILQGASAGGKEVGKAFANKMFNYLKMMGNKLESGEIKAITAQILQKTKLSSREILTLISNSLELEGKEAVAAELRVLNTEINQKFRQLIKDGLKGILKNAKGSAETVANNYKDFVQKAFESSLTGYKNALIQVLGNGYEDYIDNLITGKLDDLIKGAIKNYIDATIFDGEFTKNFPIEGGPSLLIKVIVKNGALSGGVEYTYSHEGWSATLTLHVEGSIGEKGEITDGKWTGTVSGGGPSSSFNLFGLGEDKTCTDHIDSKGGGNLTGAITDKIKMTLHLTGTITANGTFWCEPIKDVHNKPIEDPFTIELFKTKATE